jgi:transposase
MFAIGSRHDSRTAHEMGWWFVTAIRGGRLREHAARAQRPVNQYSTNPCFSKKGAAFERFFNKIKQCRRVATRYDKLAANYLAYIQLASIRLWLRVNESTP